MGTSKWYIFSQNKIQTRLIFLINIQHHLDNMAKNVFKPKGKKPIGESNRQWDELIEKIIQGEVVPVIGPEFLAKKVEDDENININQQEDEIQWANPHQELINMLAESKGIKPNHKSFSELLYDDAFPASERKEIYDMLGEVFPTTIRLSKG